MTNAGLSTPAITEVRSIMVSSLQLHSNARRLIVRVLSEAYAFHLCCVHKPTCIRYACTAHHQQLLCSQWPLTQANSLPLTLLEDICLLSIQQGIQSCIRSAQADKEASKLLNTVEQSLMSTNTAAMAVSSIGPCPRTPQPLPQR